MCLSVPPDQYLPDNYTLMWLISYSFNYLTLLTIKVVVSDKENVLVCEWETIIKLRQVDFSWTGVDILISNTQNILIMLRESMCVLWIMRTFWVHSIGRNISACCVHNGLNVLLSQSLSCTQLWIYVRVQEVRKT